MTIKLTKMQAEEIGHLFDVAEGEMHDTEAHDAAGIASWKFDADAYAALLRGDGITKAQAYRLIDEINWHAGKFQQDEASGLHRSMDNLIDKIKRSQE